MKKWLLSSISFSVALSTTLLAFSLPLQAEQLEQPYDKLKKQIDIMSNIITTSLSDGKSRRHRAANVDGIYLKNQGVVFEIKNSRNFHFEHLNLSSQAWGAIAPVPPVAPLAPIVIGDGDVEVMFADDMERAAEAYEEVIEAFREQSEHARDLREEQRDLAYEVRNLARRKRDLEFELRHANQDDDDEQQTRGNIKEIDQQMKRLEQKAEQLSQRAEKEEQALKKQQQQRQQKVAKAKKDYFVKLDNTIAETLCDYGAGLRKLAQNEHVTFVIDLGGQLQSGATKKVHTFTKKDIVSCVIQDKTAQQLLTNAQSYYF